MKRFSLFLSYLFAALGFLFTIGMCIALPILGMRGIATVASADRFAFLNYTLSYIILLLVLLADTCLFLLLENVRRNRIFTEKSSFHAGLLRELVKDSLPGLAYKSERLYENINTIFIVRYIPTIGNIPLMRWGFLYITEPISIYNHVDDMNL